MRKISIRNPSAASCRVVSRRNCRDGAGEKHEFVTRFTTASFFFTTDNDSDNDVGHPIHPDARESQAKLRFLSRLLTIGEWSRRRSVVRS